MRVIDFCGPSGVGKSTTYRAMCALGGFVPALSIDYSGSDAVLRREARRDPGLRAFIDLLELAFRTARGPRLKTRYRHTFRSLRMAVQARTMPGDRAVVIDGGLCQRGQAIDRIESDIGFERYYAAMPAPDLVLSFSADLATIRQRNRARGGDHDRSGDAARSAEVHARAREVLAARGIPVHIVDTTRPPDDNARALLGIIAAVPDQSARPVRVEPARPGGQVAVLPAPDRGARR